MTDILKLDQVSRYFGAHKAVNDVSLRVQAGESIALVGHNGAGKTTLFKMILGLIQPSSGHISVQTHHGQSSAKIAFLPEAIAFHKALTGIEVLSLFARLRHINLDEVHLALERVGLADAATKRVGTYSKGMRQRLGLAQALMGNSDLLILDEPTTGLDPASRRRFYTLLDDLRHNGTTILLSSHSLSEIGAYTDRVAILAQGSLLADGPVDQLAKDAGLPSQITLRLKPGCEDIFHQKLAQSGLDLPLSTGLSQRFTVADQEKVRILKTLLSFEELLDDIHLQSATIEDLYAHYHDGSTDPMRIRIKAREDETIRKAAE